MTYIRQLPIVSSVKSLHHPRIEDLSISTVLYALSDPVRLEIVVYLAEVGESACNAIDPRIPKSTISHHFKVLRESGLVHVRVQGTHRLLSLRARDLEDRFPGFLAIVVSLAQKTLAEPKG